MTPERHEPLPLRDVVIVPYIAVIVGMYVARSAWIAFWLYQLGMAAVLTYDRQWFRLRDLGRSRSGWAIGGAAVALLCGPVLLWLATVNGVGPTMLAGVATFGPPLPAWPLFVAGFCLTNPWLEELYWRGYRGDASGSVAWSDVWFAGYHPLFLVPFVGWLWAACAFPLLVGFAWLSRRVARVSGGLLAPALTHLAADLSILTAAWVLLSHAG